MQEIVMDEEEPDVEQKTSPPSSVQKETGRCFPQTIRSGRTYTYVVLFLSRGRGSPLTTLTPSQIATEITAERER
ncbi:hypothetical protein ACOMHN_045268 [Nucella lapillus]